MKLGDRQQLFARLHYALMGEAFRQGYEIREGEVLRPVEMQKIYYDSGRSKTMDSEHLNKCAVDLHFFKDGKGPLYPVELGLFWESLHEGCRWGGNFDRDWRKEDRFKDQPHFELRDTPK